MTVKGYYLSELSRYKTVSAKKRFLTICRKEILSNLEEAKSCKNYYLGEPKEPQIEAMENEIVLIEKIRKELANERAAKVNLNN